MTLDLIWKRRNNKIFRGILWSVEDILLKLLRMESAWSAASNFDKGIHVRGSKTTRHASFRWKPKAGIDLIVNCDGVRDTIIVNVSWGGGSCTTGKHPYLTS